MMFSEIITALILIFSVKGFQGIENVNSEIIYLGLNSVSREVKESFALTSVGPESPFCY